MDTDMLLGALAETLNEHDWVLIPVISSLPPSLLGHSTVTIEAFISWYTRPFRSW